MKLKIQSLLLIMVLGTVIMSCGDDDDAPRANAYEFDGTIKDIKTAYFEDYNYYDDGGAYQFWFSPNEHDWYGEWVEYIGVRVPKELLGTKFELTEEQLYSWAWDIQYYKEIAEATDIWYNGSGYEGGMSQVKSGSVKAVDKGDGNFEVEADIVFTDDKTLKLYYSGKILDSAEEEGNGRKPASLSKENFPGKK